MKWMASMLLLILSLGSADVYFGSHAAVLLKLVKVYPEQSPSNKRSVLFENFRSGRVVVYWVSEHGKEFQVDLLEPRTDSKQQTVLNHTFALRDEISKELIVAYQATSPKDIIMRVVVGADTSCISLGKAHAGKNANLRSHPLVLGAQQQVGEQANASAAVIRLQELAERDAILAPFAWSEIGHLLLLGNKTIQQPGSMGEKAKEGGSSVPVADPPPPFKQAAHYFYRAAMRGDEAAQWTLALLFWSGLLQSVDMHQLEDNYMRELMPVGDERAGPNAVARARVLYSSSGSSENKDSSDGMLWPERIGTTWAQCASSGGSNSAKMGIAFRHLQGYGVKHSCKTAQKLYKDVAQQVLRDQNHLEKTVEVVRLRVPVLQTATIDDPLELREYHEQGALGGEISAQFNLAERWVP
jgi:TPR repeat protein